MSPSKFRLHTYNPQNKTEHWSDPVTIWQAIEMNADALQNGYLTRICPGWGKND